MPRYASLRIGTSADPIEHLRCCQLVASPILSIAHTAHCTNTTRRRRLLCVASDMLRPLDAALVGPVAAGAHYLLGLVRQSPCPLRVLTIVTTTEKRLPAQVLHSTYMSTTPVPCCHDPCYPGCPDEFRHVRHDWPNLTLNRGPRYAYLSLETLSRSFTATHVISRGPLLPPACAPRRPPPLPDRRGAASC